MNAQESKNKVKFQYYDLVAHDYLTNPLDNSQIWEDTRENTILGAYCDGATLTWGILPDRFLNLEGEKRKAVLDFLETAAPPGQKLLAASKDLFLYAPENTQFNDIDFDEILRRLTENKPGSQIYRFGNNFGPMVSPCSKGHLVEATILVGDLSTGENGGYLDPEQFRHLVSDGQGIISPELYQQLSEEKYHQIQFRGVLLDDFHYAKGTLLPRYTDNQEHTTDTVTFEALKWNQGVENVDLILPTDCFKGSAKTDRQPGLYTVKLWIGERDRSPETQYTRASELSKINEGYASDIINLQEEHLKELVDGVADPRLLEKKYVEVAEERLQTLESENIDSERIDLLYELRKIDEHRQLMGIKKFTDIKQDFVSKQFLDASTGGFVKFQRTWAVGDVRLQPHQICHPTYSEGQDLANYRSPLLSESALYANTNTLSSPKAYDPNGNPLPGVTVVCSWDWNDYLDNLRAQLDAAQSDDSVREFIDQLPNPEAIAQTGGIDRKELIIQLNSQINALNEQLNLTATLLPLQTQCEGRQIDFDGDALSLKPLFELPNTQKYLEIYHNPETAPLPLVKEAKVDYPIAMSREEMAYTMANPPVGQFNNHNQAVLILKNELNLVKKATSDIQVDYATKILQTLDKLRAQATDEEDFSLAPKYVTEVENLSKYSLNSSEAKPLDQPTISEIFQSYEAILNQLQINSLINNQRTVDLFKSALAPDDGQRKQDEMAMIRIPSHIRGKKENGVYSNGQTIDCSGYSQEELLTYQANQFYRHTQIVDETIPLETLKDFFPSESDSQLKNAVLLAKHTFDQKFNEASAYSQRVNAEKNSVVLKAITAQGKQFDISFAQQNIEHLKKLVFAFNSSQNLAIQLAQPYRPNPNYPIDVIAVNNQGEQLKIKHPQTGKLIPLKLGAIHKSDCQKLKLMNYIGQALMIKASLGNPPRENIAKELFDTARQSILDWKTTLPTDEHFRYACAAWEICTSRELNQDPSNYKVNNFVFEAFPDEIKEQAKNFQFTELFITKLKTFENGEPIPFNETIPLTLKATIDPQTQQNTPVWHSEVRSQKSEVRSNFGQEDFSTIVSDHPDVSIPIGAAWDKGFQLPLNTKVDGIITPDPAATATLDVQTPNIREILKGNPLKIGKIQDLEAKGRHFEGETLTFRLKRIDAPPKPTLFLGHQKLAELSPDDYKTLSQSGVDLTKPISIKLTSIGIDKGLLHLGQLPNGQVLRFEQIAMTAAKDLKTRRFDNETVELQLRPVNQESKTQWGLETTLDGQPQLIGIFTQKADKAAISSLSPRDGLEFEATITSNVTRYKLTIDADHIKYPRDGQWQYLNPPKSQTEANIDETAEYFLNTLKYQPTLFYQTYRSWETPNGQEKLPTLGLTVDVRLATKLEEELKKQGISYVQRNNRTHGKGLEHQRSMVSFEMVTNYIPANTQQQLINQYGVPLEAKFKTPNESPYHQALTSIPKRPPSERKAIRNNSELHDYFSANNSLKTTLPTLYSVESYEWQQGDSLTELKTPRVTVHDSNLAEITQWLEQQNYSYEIATHPHDIELESQLGYHLIRVNPSNFSPESKIELHQYLSQYGTILDGNINGSYYQRLQEIAKPLSLNKIVEQTQQTNAITQEKTDEVSLKEAQVSLPQSQDNEPSLSLKITGKPVQMVYPLKLHGEPNPLPVDTCIEAMRGYGRTHTTRNFEPDKAYGFKEGDLAIAYSGDKNNPTHQVLFRVGKQYQITAEMINDPSYRQQWANLEKHSEKELDSFRGKEAWGLQFEPIGDYKNGQVYDFISGKDLTDNIIKVQSDAVQKVESKPNDITLLIPVSSNPTVEQHLDKLESSQATYLSINNIPSDPEFNLNKLMEQQERAQIVAPIALEYLKIKDPSNAETRHFKGSELTFDYDGYHLTMTDNKTNQTKMKARFTGVDPVTKKTQWKSELPDNSPGLTEADVSQWTSDKTKNYIKQEMVKQAQQQSIVKINVNR